MEGIGGGPGSWGTEPAAVVAGIDAVLAACWRQVGSEVSHRASRQKENTLAAAVVAAAAGIAGGQQAGLDYSVGTACAEQERYQDDQ
jgi:hypothetical protein